MFSNFKCIRLGSPDNECIEKEKEKKERCSIVQLLPT